MADEISHKNIGDVVVNSGPCYTGKQYSNDYLIEMLRLATVRFCQEDSMIRGITFVGIPVKDQDVALKFYTECMGFKIATDRPFTASQRWIELLIPGAETGLALYTPEGHESRIGQFQSIAFWCDDVFATAAILKEKGVVFAQDPKKEPWGSTALIMDADGNQFALSSKR